MLMAATMGNLDAMDYLYEKAQELERAAEILQPAVAAENLIDRC